MRFRENVNAGRISRAPDDGELIVLRVIRSDVTHVAGVDHRPRGFAAGACGRGEND